MLIIFTPLFSILASDRRLPYGMAVSDLLMRFFKEKPEG